MVQKAYNGMLDVVLRGDEASRARCDGTADLVDGEGPPCVRSLGALAERERAPLAPKLDHRGVVTDALGAVEKHTQRIFAKLDLAPDDDAADRPRGRPPPPRRG